MSSTFFKKSFVNGNSSFPGVLFEVREAHVDFRESLRLRIHIGAHVVVQEATGNKAHEHDQFRLVLPQEVQVSAHNADAASGTRKRGRPRKTEE